MLAEITTTVQQSMSAEVVTAWFRSMTRGRGFKMSLAAGLSNAWRMYVMSMIPILCLDFDGVLHSYKSGWKGARVIPDPPVPGAIDWLRSLLGVPDKMGIGPRYRDFEVCILSSRSHQWGGRKAMKRWLMRHGLEPEYLELIRFPLFKPPAFLTIDDRAWRFAGEFPTAKQMLEVQPWWKASATQPTTDG